MPCGEAAERDVPALRPACASRRLPRLLRDSATRSGWWACYAGICPSRFAPPTAQRLVLIDHNEMGQTISGLDERNCSKC
jgi:hypothetical protein